MNYHKELERIYVLLKHYEIEKKKEKKRIIKGGETIPNRKCWDCLNCDENRKYNLQANKTNPINYRSIINY